MYLIPWTAQTRSLKHFHIVVSKGINNAFVLSEFNPDHKSQTEIAERGGKVAGTYMYLQSI